MPDESRIEKQLKEMNATINGSGEVIGTEEPQSRIEKLLEEINGNLGKSSGGGVKPDWSVNDENTDGYIAYKPAIKSGTAYLSTVENAASSAGASRSHAEGSETVTRGKNSHAEGRKTLAEGENSHAEGCLSVSHGESSHAEGYSTIAQGLYQHVSGRYNTEDTEDKYAEIVGNGAYDMSSHTAKRSNARTLDWSGNEWLAGKLTVGTDPVDDMDVATKKYVDDLVAELQKKIDAMTPSGS